MNNLITWFEIPVYRFEEAKSFYEAVFAIRLEILDLGALTMAVFPNDLASGALCQGDWYHPSEQGVTLHLRVDSIERALSQVEIKGGSILQPRKQISAEQGYMALIKDCEGNRLALRAPH